MWAHSCEVVDTQVGVFVYLCYYLCWMYLELCGFSQELVKDVSLVDINLVGFILSVGGFDYGHFALIFVVLQLVTLLSDSDRSNGIDMRAIRLPFGVNLLLSGVY